MSQEPMVGPARRVPFTSGATGHGVVARFAFVLSSMSGLGHVARAVAILEHLRGARAVVAAHPSAHGFIQAHLDRLPCAVELIPLTYGQFGDRHDAAPADLYGMDEAAAFMEQNVETVAAVEDCRVIVNDFLRQGPILKNGGFLVGLYHSRLSTTSSDDLASQFWKRRSQAIAESSDLFVHMSPDPRAARASLRLKVPSIFVPLIVRRIHSSRQEVLYRLGLRASDRFFLVHTRGLEEEGRVLSETTCAAARIGLRHKIVALNGQDECVMRGHECIAEADLVISKPGMGVLSECLAYGTPVVFWPDPSNPERVDKERLLRSLFLGADRPADSMFSDPIVRTWETRSTWPSRHFNASGAEVVAFLLSKLHEPGARSNERRTIVRTALEATAVRWPNRVHSSL